MKSPLPQIIASTEQLLAPGGTLLGHFTQLEVAALESNDYSVTPLIDNRSPGLMIARKYDLNGPKPQSKNLMDRDVVIVSSLKQKPRLAG